MKNPTVGFAPNGQFIRPTSTFRNQISAETNAEFPPERGRYHLYVSYACPWAHRVLIVRKLKGLEDILPFTSVHWRLPLATGWRFATVDDAVSGENTGPDPLHANVKEASQLYTIADPEYSGRFTVPILWDKKKDTIVNNESSEIIRMLYTAFDGLLSKDYRSVDLYPVSLRSEIDLANTWMYDHVNNGVYKSGLAKSQSAYDTAVSTLFENLDKAEQHLSTTGGPFYFGTQLTEVDVRLFVTIVRFDPVYVQHFKCNIRDIRSGYPAIHKWLQSLYWDHPAFQSTTNFDHIKRHYMESHEMINPTVRPPSADFVAFQLIRQYQRIVSAGPVPNILPKGEGVAATIGRL